MLMKSLKIFKLPEKSTLLILCRYLNAGILKAFYAFFIFGDFLLYYNENIVILQF